MPTRRQDAPAQQFDTTLKKLFQTLPSRLIELVMGAQPIELVTIELPSVKQRRADVAYRLPDGQLHQFELQSDNDDEMDQRMLEYYALFWRQDKQPPVQHVLYVGSAPLKMTGRVEHTHLQYNYEVIDIREFDAELLASSEYLSDNLMAVLCHNGTEPAIVQQILRKIALLPERQGMDCLEQLLILSLLRKAETIVIKEYRNMSLELNIEDSPFLRGIFLKGEKRGIKIGEKRGQSRLLQIQLEWRFGKLPKWALQQLKAADAGRLERWGAKLLDSKSLEDVIPNPGRARSRARQ